MPAPNGSLTIAIGIATAGRAAILCETLATLREQVRPPDRVVVCAPSPADTVGAAQTAPGVETLYGVRGSSIQRNVIIDACRDCEIILFLDDDFIMDPEYILKLDALHRLHPDIAMLTGLVLLDGVTTGGVAVEAARAAIRAAAAAPRGGAIDDIYNGYGCNMSARMDLVHRYNIRFDEMLPLYGWLEDVDFSRCLAKYGRIARATELRGVHLGVKAGRQTGTRLGYSQIANPIYILRKGNFTLRRALAQISRNVSANLLRSLFPEPYVDRRGRVIGNLLGLIDLLRGRLQPERVIRL
ncbi:glycosyltransferase family 2 protein [Methylobacterium nodulans]|uniref:Glycosyl transferase, family 2 n=1 Tax=Methylobacterium nodulans (strain LMG 21967 / CNCM I-2342 / ORS 2060) TaxID=460265 RepID=B8IGJ1_METNO|nr:glycosyltransferase [Methylobacterium nodulans]ACL55891.1 glycosyl transferase, family 2 [Methylobacterium nodulans ORS 2060]